jgi:hypothetical protein
MRHMGHSLMVAVVVLIAVAPASSAEVTVVGELVDQTCYMKDKNNVGVVHQDCAVMCAMKGQTLALVTDKGEVLKIAGDLTSDNNAVLAPHMSHRVVLTGLIIEKSGTKVITATALKMAPPRF